MNMQRYIAALLFAATVLLVSCESLPSRQPPMEVWWDMRRQGKGKPQETSAFFSDGRASRMPVPGTIARGHLNDDDTYATGMVSPTMYLGKNPETIDAKLLQRGQDRFNIYCSPCHGRTGMGNGIVAIKANGTWIPSNLQEDRVKGLADGEIYQVITNGRRSMPAYRFQIVEHDRWAIVAYLRALQRTTGGTLEDVPQEMRADVR